MDGAFLMLATNMFVIGCEDGRVGEIVEEVMRGAAKAQGNIAASRIQ